MSDTEPLYVVAYEPGAEHPALPTWANRTPNPAGLAPGPPDEISRRAVPGVPGAYQLRNVLSDAECEAFMALSERMGYIPDAAVSLPRAIRHNDSVTWVVDEDTDGLLWRRVATLCQDWDNLFNGREAVGLNARFRFYRYGPGDFFQAHTDGDWPGSRVIDELLVPNAYPDRYSCMTFLVLLNDDFEGGATRFLVNAADPGRPARREDDVQAVDVFTPRGGVLCFPHGMHPLQCVHSSEPLTAGTKYIIRTDLLFLLDTPAATH